MPLPSRHHLRGAWVLFGVVAIAALGGASFLAGRGGSRKAAAVPVASTAAVVAPQPPPAPPADVTRASTRRVRPSQNPAQVLASMDVAPAEARSIHEALRSIGTFKSIFPGDQVRIERRATDGAFRSLSWRQGRDREYVVRPCDTGFCGAERDYVRRTVRTLVSVTIQTSAWDALQSAGYDPALIARAADVLAWDVDFYQDVRPGDSLKLVVDRFEADGRFVRYGDVLGIEYLGKVTGRKRLFRYVDASLPGREEERSGYYDDAGTSAKRGFLKAPLPYVHLTSTFGNRRHPLLGYVRAHQGVDYGAPVGTPVWAVGDGTVTQAGWSGGCGLSVQIRHSNGFDTVFCHLSKVQVSSGSRVRQQQVVGRVGSTGLSTGPHLHYAVRRGGAYVNPLQLKFPRGEPLRKDQLSQFLASTDAVRRQLDVVPVALLD